MAFEWDAAERAAFDQAFQAHLAARFPDAVIRVEGNGRQWWFTFPDGTRAGLWEPNYFFSFPSFALPTLVAQAATLITRQKDGV